MDVSITPISGNVEYDMEAAAATSITWELPWIDSLRPQNCEDPAFEKEVWAQRVLMEWGTCGFTAHVGYGGAGTGTLPAATVFFAPTRYFPGYETLPTFPPSADAIIISNVYVSPAYMGLYLEHQLLEVVIEDARRRGVKAVETFVRRDETLVPDDLRGVDSDYYPEAYGGWEDRSLAEAGATVEDNLSIAPLLSEDIVIEQGFHLVQDHPLYPRYRREVKNRETVFSAVERSDAEDEQEKVWPTVMGGRRNLQRVGARSSALQRLKYRGGPFNPTSSLLRASIVHRR